MKKQNKTRLILKKVVKTNKTLQTFIKQTFKNYQSMKKKIKTIWACVIACLILQSCGVTKATVSKPAAGTSTTITITTNNPITTEVSPDVNLKGKGE